MQQPQQQKEKACSLARRTIHHSPFSFCNCIDIIVIISIAIIFLSGFVISSPAYAQKTSPNINDGSFIPRVISDEQAAGKQEQQQLIPPDCDDEICIQMR